MNHWLYLGIGLGVSLLGNIPLMGLPGALLLGIVFEIMKTLSMAVRIYGDKMWPAAILTTFLWGLLLWPCYWLNSWLGWHELITWFLWFGIGLVVAAIVYRTM